MYDRDDREVEPINVGNFGHVDYVFDDMPCCKRCGLVRPAEGWARPCKGPSELSLRTTEPQSTTEPKLEPCPFYPHGVGFIRNESGRYNGVVWVECDWPSHAVRLVAGEDAAPPCGARTAEYQTEQEAVKAWNSRTPAPTVAPEVDRAPSYGPCSACGDGDIEMKYHSHERKRLQDAEDLPPNSDSRLRPRTVEAAPLTSLTTPRSEAGSRHPHYTHQDDQHIQDLFDSLPECPTEEQAEAVLQACGTSGKQVVNEFIERLLRENLELNQKVAGSVAGTGEDDLRTPLDEIEAALISIAEGTSPEEGVRQAFDVINHERLKLNAAASPVAPVEQSDAYLEIPCAGCHQGTDAGLLLCPTCVDEGHAAPLAETEDEAPNKK